MPDADYERLIADVIRANARMVPNEPIPADAIWPIYLPDPDDLAREIVRALPRPLVIDGKEATDG